MKHDGYLVREHRGGLAESLATTFTVKDRAELVEAIARSLAPYGVTVKADDVEISPYAYDHRIDWDSHIITIRGYGVWGFSKGGMPA